MLPERLQRFYTEPIKVLNDGEIQLIDIMGDDQAIVDAARVSYGAGTKRVSEDRALIRYLMRHAHTSPFEMCEIKLRVRVPMDCWRQWSRTRTASLNEGSTRYSEAIDSCQTTLPGEWRLQAKDNKQGSDGFLQEWPGGFLKPLFDRETTPGEYLTEQEQSLQNHARRIYNERLALGVAREQARKDLPLSTYTAAIWKIDLHNLLRFLSLRMDSHAQKEIRDFANAVAEIVKIWVPDTWEAFEDYHVLRSGMQLSRLEIVGMQRVFESLLWSNTGNLTVQDMTQVAIRESGLKGREAEEFKTKLQTFFKTTVQVVKSPEPAPNSVDNTFDKLYKLYMSGTVDSDKILQMLEGKIPTP